MRNILVIVSLLIAGIANGQTITRKAVFTKGQQFERTGSVKVVMNMEMMGQTMEMSNTNFTMTSTIKVNEAGAQDYKVSNTITKATGAVTAMGQAMTYDSEKKEDANNELGKILGAKIGKTINLTVDKKGTVTASDAPPKEAEEKKDIMGNLGEGVLGDEGNIVGSTFELVTNIPAGRTLKVGDSWTDSSSNAENSEKQVTTFTVKAINGPDADIAINQKLERSGTMDQGGQEIKMKLNGTSTGNCVMEVSTGLIKNRNITMKGIGTIEAAGQEVPFSLNMELGDQVVKK